MQPQWLSEFLRAIGQLPVIVTLATVDRDGSPRARSVVIRHIAPDGALWFTSDSRSEKAAQLAGRNEAEIVAWLPGSREQFRLLGSVDSLGVAATGGMRLQLWRGLNPQVRATFQWPAPGEPKSQPDSAFAQSVEADAPIAENFEALFLEPERVEQLILSGHPHIRRRWSAAGGWDCEELNP